MKYTSLIVIKTIDKKPHILTTTKNFHIAVRDILQDINIIVKDNPDEIRRIKKVLFEQEEYHLLDLGLEISYTIIKNEYKNTTYVGIITKENKVVHTVIRDSKELAGKKLLEYLRIKESIEFSDVYLAMINDGLKTNNFFESFYCNLTICKK